MSDTRTNVNGYGDGDTVNGYDQAQYLPDPREIRRRETIRRAILIGFTVLGGSIFAYAIVKAYGVDAIIRYIVDLWPVLLAPPVGWMLGRITAKELYHPDGRILVNLDTDNHTFRAVFVPEELFRYIDQCGNNVVYHTPTGRPVYLTERLDLQNGLVKYGWVHENSALEVMTRETAYNRWFDTLSRTMSDNLQLMHLPEVIGMGYTRSTLRRHLDDIAKAVGLDNSARISGERDVPDPLDENPDSDASVSEASTPMDAVNGQEGQHGS